MSHSPLSSVWPLLPAPDANDVPFSENESVWTRFVREIVAGDLPTDSARIALLQTIMLASPRACATAGTPALMEALQEIPRGAQKTAVLQRLAQWWQQEFGDELNPLWSADIAHYRVALRAIRGLGPETADRLLLFGASLPVFPIDRAILRVAVRHGWIDLPVDDEGAQTTFRSAFGPDINSQQSAARGLKSIGATFCGREPNCVECPLRSLLPEHGPLAVDQC